MNELSDSAVIELLAQREGFYRTTFDELSFSDANRILQRPCWKIKRTGDYPHRKLPDYLESLDSLQPILATLTEEEWEKLDALTFQFMLDGIGIPITQLRPHQVKKFYLLMKPSQLARCIGKVIAGEKGE